MRLPKDEEAMTRYVRPPALGSPEGWSEGASAM